jgi:hypothetical protein
MFYELGRALQESSFTYLNALLQYLPESDLAISRNSYSQGNRYRGQDFNMVLVQG